MIEEFDILTMQERDQFIGGTTSHLGVSHPYTPLAILADRTLAPVVKTQREEQRYYRVTAIEMALAQKNLLKPGDSVHFILEDLDPQTNETVRDPRVVVITENEGQKVENEAIGDINLSEFWKEKLKEYNHIIIERPRIPGEGTTPSMKL